VTILAVPGQVGSIVATGSANALTIDAAGVVVTLRNLVIIGLGTSVDGIEFKQGWALLVEGMRDRQHHGQRHPRRRAGRAPDSQGHHDPATSAAAAS
jgi:hypothetical protein